MAFANISNVKILDYEHKYEEQFLTVCASSTDGVSDSEVLNKLPGLSMPHFVELVNKLSKNGKLDLIKRGNKLLYKSKKTTQNFVTSDVNEKLIFQSLEEAGSKGRFCL
uniref:DNA-directed RNA polymerase III subunit RPC6 (Trinotate prediction) n=1 Tax=Henneguya salminicola TaxID=69463 RepID=A0A6G3MFR6_HENSL